MATVNVPQFLATRLRNAGAALHTACEKMPEDRIAWHPTTEGNAGRDALDQALECAYLNEWAARAFQSGQVPPFDSAEYKSKPNQYRNKREALAWLQRGTNVLADAVAAFSADVIGDTISNPITGTQQTWAEFADFFYWNTVYHEGQVNYIQVLYGDLT